MSSINSSGTSTDYATLLNNLKTSYAEGILGSMDDTEVVSGISGNTLQQWNMLQTNSKAYKALLAAQESGSVKQDTNSHELLSDKLFNDYYDPETKTYNATYTPTTGNNIEIDDESTAGDILNDMRSLALAAIGNTSTLNNVHYDYFESMRSYIASALVTSGASSSTTVTTGEAQAATVKGNAEYRLLTDDQSFTVAGNNGETTYSFGVGASLEEVAAAINADSGATGVTAELVENTDGTYSVALSSAKTGSDQFVRVDQLQGDLFATTGSSVSGAGTNATTSEAEVVATGADTQAAIAAGMAGGKLYEDVQFTIQGRNGSQSFSFAKGATTEDIVAAINAASGTTGVNAEAIYNSAGVADGIGLLADKAGSGNYVQVKQTKGALFAAEGKTTSAAGSSVDGNSDGPAISSLSDLGVVSIDGVTYSFADLAPGGKASLENNPDAALAVLDQTLRDIYDGRAVISGFDPAETYIAGVDLNNSGSTASTNTREYGNFGSTAMTTWLAKYAVDD